MDIFMLPKWEIIDIRQNGNVLGVRNSLMRILRLEGKMRKPNKKGCVVSQDVCLFHCSPLICWHGCKMALKHKCKAAEEYWKEDSQTGGKE